LKLIRNAKKGKVFPESPLGREGLERVEKRNEHQDNRTVLIKGS